MSNQDGIKKGLYDEKQMHLFNEKILDDMRRNNINVLAIYYSPFSKYDNNYSFKPNPGMLLRAKYELNISMKDSYFIGDQLSDVIAGLRSNVRPLLVKTGIYEGNLLESKLYNDIQPKTFESLSEISSYIKLIESNKYM